jgi:hypothetical protein
MGVDAVLALIPTAIIPPAVALSTKLALVLVRAVPCIYHWRRGGLERALQASLGEEGMHRICVLGAQALVVSKFQPSFSMRVGAVWVKRQPM